MVCHEVCIANTPNSCGLPKELAAHLYQSISPSKKCRSSSAGSANKENNMDGIILDSLEKVRPLSINLVRCTPLKSPTNSTDLSITSSMLADSIQSDDSLV